MSDVLRPSFVTTGLGYTYSLRDAHGGNILTIEVSRVRQRGGSPYALLKTSTTLPGVTPIPGTDRVLTGEVYLMNPRSRIEYADRLMEVIPDQADGGLNYRAVLEELGSLVMDREEHGTTIHPIGAPHWTKRHTDYLIDGILPIRKPTIVYGAGGVGKSILAAYMAVCVQAGVPFLGIPVKQANVLYLDWETDEEDISARVMAVAQGLNLPMPTPHYAAMVRPIEDQAVALAAQIKRERIELVIIDSVGMAMPSGRDNGDPAEGALRYFKALHTLGVATLSIDHVSGDDMRRGRAGANKPYGSVYKWNSAREARELRERKPPDHHGSHLLFKHRKSNLGRLRPDMALRLLWDEASGVAQFSRETFEPVTVQPLPDQIIDIVEMGSATPRQIADLLSNDDTMVNELDVRRELKALKGEGRITYGGDGQIRAVASSIPSDVSESEQLPLLDE